MIASVKKESPNILYFDSSIRDMLCYDSSNNLCNQIRLLNYEGQAIYSEIEYIINDYQLSVSDDIFKYCDADNKILVTGQSVNDFLTVNYDNIMTMITSVTQHIDRQIMVHEQDMIKLFSIQEKSNEKNKLMKQKMDSISNGMSKYGI